MAQLRGWTGGAPFFHPLNRPGTEAIRSFGWPTLRFSEGSVFRLGLTSDVMVKQDMLRHMRTTINLPDDLIRQAKKAALEADSTLTEIIGNTLREALAKPRRKNPRKELKLITYGKGGVHPGVDLDDTSALLDRMDGC